MMRLTLGSFVAAAAAIVAFSAAGDARADDEFDATSTGKGEVTVSTKGDWHINKSYPWKAGDKKFDASSFGEKSAKLTGLPSGKVHIKGAVCSGDKCKTFEKDVDVK